MAFLPPSKSSSQGFTTGTFQSATWTTPDGEVTDLGSGITVLPDNRPVNGIHRLEVMRRSEPVTFPVTFKPKFKDHKLLHQKSKHSGGWQPKKQRNKK